MQVKLIATSFSLAGALLLTALTVGLSAPAARAQAQQQVLYNSLPNPFIAPGTSTQASFRTAFADTIGNNAITSLTADRLELQGGAGPVDIQQVTINLGNRNLDSILVRPRLRVYDSDRIITDPNTGAQFPDRPGTILAALDLPVITLNAAPNASSAFLQDYTFNLPFGALGLPFGNGNYWFGLVFDNVNGTLNTTEQQLENIAFGRYLNPNKGIGTNPGSAGFSADVLFGNDVGGSYDQSNPLAPNDQFTTYGFFNFGGDGSANLGFRILTFEVPEPGTFVLIGAGLPLLGMARRRRRA